MNLFEFVRYIISGLIVGIFFIIFNYIFVYLLHFDLPISVTFSYILTTPISFILQRNFTFRNLDEPLTQIIRFLIVVISLLIISKLINQILSELMSVNSIIIFYWFVTSIVNFLVYKFYVFRKHTQN